MEELEERDRQAAASRGADEADGLAARRGELLDRLTPPPREPRRPRGGVRILDDREAARALILGTWQFIQETSDDLARRSDELARQQEADVAEIRRVRDEQMAELERSRPLLQRAGIPHAIDAYRELSDFLLFWAVVADSAGVGVERFVLGFVPGTLHLLQMLYDFIGWWILSFIDTFPEHLGDLSPRNRRIMEESGQRFDQSLVAMIDGIRGMWTAIEQEEDPLQRARLLGDAIGQIIPMLITLRAMRTPGGGGGGAAPAAAISRPAMLMQTTTGEVVLVGGSDVLAVARARVSALADRVGRALPPPVPTLGRATIVMAENATRPDAGQTVRGAADRGTGGGRATGQRGVGDGEGAGGPGGPGGGGRPQAPNQRPHPRPRADGAGLVAAETDAQLSRRAQTQREMSRISQERARRLAQVEGAHARLSAAAQRARARWRGQTSAGPEPRGVRPLGERVRDIRSLMPDEALRHLHQMLEPNARRLGEINRRLDRISGLERAGRNRGNPALLDDYLGKLQSEGRVTGPERRASSSRSRDALLAERDAITAENTLLDSEMRWHEWNLDPNRGILRFEYAGRYGVRPYAELNGLIEGTQAHHLIEQRFAAAMGQNPARMPAVLLTPAEHQVFTNRWAQRFPQRQYPRGTLDVTTAQLETAAREIYADFPQLLDALGLR